MPSLSRHGAAPLLRTVGGKPHASSEHHEEDAKQAGAMTLEMTEEDINASPVDSEDEVTEPSRPPSPPLTSQSSSSSRARGKSGTNKAAKKGTWKADRRVQPPKAGTYQRGQADKAGMSRMDEKENVGVAMQSLAEKRNAEEQIFDGLELSKRVRTGPKTFTKNIHASQSNSSGKFGVRKQYGKFKKMYGKSRTNPRISDDDDDPDDADLFKEVEPPPVKSTKESNKSEETIPEDAPQPNSPGKVPRPNLLEIFADYAQPTSSPADNDTDLGNIDKPSNQDAARSRKAIDDQQQNLKVEALAAEDLDSRCAICEVPVDPAQSAAFYSTRPRTVRNQALFCKQHKRVAALQHYTDLGLPEIDWDALPHKIRSYRPQLLALLRNETDVESEFRKRHAARLLSGKAAALPSRRKNSDLKDVDRDEADDSMGFYGPRGKRIMMEVITAELVDEIKDASEKDPIVGRSGFAAFVQAVLVPELTVLLAMEDLGGVGQGVARETIARSADLGVLLHEDLDDVVAVGSGEESSEESSEAESEGLSEVESKDLSEVDSEELERMGWG